MYENESDTTEDEQTSTSMRQGLDLFRLWFKNRFDF